MSERERHTHSLWYVSIMLFCQPHPIRTGVFVLQPCSSDAGILLIHDKLNILSVLLNVIRYLDAGQASSNGEDFQLSARRVLIGH